MGISELQAELEKIGVSRRLYSLKGARDERLCIELRNGRWSVFFVERGQERTLREFGDENSACEFMLNELKFEV